MIAVTGAAGFVGARLVRRLRAAGREVRAIGRAEWEAPADLDPGLLAGARAVVHAAAYVPRDPSDPAEAERCLAVNALGTLRVLRAVEAAGVPRLVHLSTGNLYRPSDRPAAEDAPIDPTGRGAVYLASKAVADVWARAHAGRCSVVVLRPSAVYGPGMRGGMVKAFVDGIRAGRALKVADGGRFSSDLVAVDDVVDAVIAAADGDARGAYNVGSGRLTSVLEVAETLARLAGTGSLEVAPPNPGPPPGFAPLDVTRARRDLGYAPRGVEDGLRVMLEEG